MRKLIAIVAASLMGLVGLSLIAAQGTPTDAPNDDFCYHITEEIGGSILSEGPCEP